jgi:uncharacterized protein involved in cysteine biosynthesis
MIPNLLGSYGGAAKWMLPTVLTCTFVYLFLVNHIQAVIQQHWLDRLHAQNAPKVKNQEVGADSRESRIILLPKCIGATLIRETRTTAQVIKQL